MGIRTLILTAGVGAGHNQAANAIQAALAELPEIDDVARIDTLDTTPEAFNRLYDDAYFALVSDVPWLIGWGYDNQDAPFKLAPAVRWWDQLNTLSLVRAIRELDPDVVICTHFLPARLVALLLARGQLRASLTVATTDYDFQGLWLTTPFTHFFVAREETRRFVMDLGVPGDRIAASGIPVRLGLGDPVDEAQVRQRFGLDPDLPVVLISAGAAGGSYTVNTIQQALRVEHPFQAVVICGHNEELKREIDDLVAGRTDQFKVIGFTTEMADLLRIAALFVGKPGGLSSSECMAAGLPMVLVNPIPGQEVRNADYLVEEGAAVRCNYATTIGFKLDALLADPERLRTMAANARRVGRADSARTVVNGAVQLLTPPLWVTREAQKSMQYVAEHGVAAADLPDERALLTLTDPVTGGSRAVATRAQLRALGVSTWSHEVTLARETLRDPRWRQQNLDLAVATKWLLGDQESCTFGLSG
ncbi:MAG TPA: glycosyltransferase [Micropruina sp.]|jgi:processive 1,2-diacylglycerol beta-glucosyltransferase|nr:glycosyltransferase [Micropruina sp.]